MVKCQQCDKRAYYGFTKLVVCDKHREEGMINFLHKKCLNEECSKIPIFGFLLDKKPSYCFTHAVDGMINIKSKKCLSQSCNTIPSFGLPSDKNPTYCSIHALEGMINLHSKKCLVDYCSKNPSFGLPSDKLASYCKAHARNGMTNIINKKCLDLNCETSPSFGLLSDNRPSYCKVHAEKGMVNIKSKKCLNKHCNKHPSFGFMLDKIPSYCKAHAKEGMTDIKSKRCKFESCNKYPNFGLPSDKSSSYCKTHATEEMIDIKSKHCKLCKLTRSYISGYCAPCFYYLNPEHIKTKRHKTRENTFMYQLKEIYPNIILDKAVDGGCSRKRPDGLIDLYTHSIIIEIDEDQHRGYSCENKRSMQLFTDLGSRPIIFIRLNPDSYISNGKKIKGCFSLSKSLGQLIPNEKEISERFNVLLETIDECKLVPDKTVTVVELFFNEVFST